MQIIGDSYDDSILRITPTEHPITGRMIFWITLEELIDTRSLSDFLESTHHPTIKAS
jgi:hypothetical protein